MAVYTVHEPPWRGDNALAHTERFVFVRDGFSWLAFLFGWLWMLVRGLWLECLGLVAITLGLTFGLWAVGAGPVGIWFALTMVALLVGFEAASLRRAALERRGWITQGVVVADDVEAAERRFFDAWVSAAPAKRPPTAPPSSPIRRPGSVSPHDVIGLFPEPGART